MIKKKRQTHHYVDNKRLLAEITPYVEEVKRCREAGLEREDWPLLPKYVGQAVFDIANHLSYKPNFKSYSFREEMIGDAIENCLMYIHNFDPNKSKNPFSYITQIMYFAFIRRIQKEQKQQYIRQKSMIHAATMNTLVDGSGHHFHSMDSKLDFNMDRHRSLQEKFEPNVDRPKKKRAPKGVERFIDDPDSDTTDDRDDQGPVDTTSREGQPLVDAGEGQGRV